MNKKLILKQVEQLYNAYKEGLLGGEIMPEDENPGLEKDSIQNYLYLTLPMALNYQRNSYVLWQNAKKTYNDPATNFVFNPEKVSKSTFEQVQKALTKYKVALQPNKQTEIWIKLATTILEDYNGDIRKIFEENSHDVDKIRKVLQVDKKKKFPYLSGTKICNYWLYVIYQYTGCEYINMKNLTVAPDTHVLKATLKLGLINEEEFSSNNSQEITINRWQELLKDHDLNPIDVHTPLWLWSRGGFENIE